MRKVLIVDDQEDWSSTLKDGLQHAGYEVETASNPTNALDKFLQASVPFDFALVDIRLVSGDESDNSGLTLSVTFKKLRPNTIVILLTQYDRTRQIAWAVRYHGIYDFIRKTPDLDRQVLETLKDAERDLRLFDSERDTFLSISLEEGQLPGIRSWGRYVLSSRDKQPFNVNINNVIQQTNFSILSTPGWKSMVESIGIDLKDKIFYFHPDVIGAFQTARTKSERLSIIFETPRDALGLPFEFIRMTNPDKYLVLQYPVSRMVTGISPKRGIITPEWLALRQKLSVLIIASNTWPDIPGVDREAEAVRALLTSQEYIPIQVKYLPTKDASYDAVRSELANNSYDIIHYAGHGSYDLNNKSASAIYFWSERNHGGNVKSMQAAEVTDILSSSGARLVYLSCCFGSATGTKNSLNDDFLGLSDAVIQAGIPSVLGFRSPVLDEQAITMATYFYQHFLERGGLDVALWESRRKLASSNFEDSTWLSPILISQH
jgi:ActR/RegA family two-component response regulator